MPGDLNLLFVAPGTSIRNAIVSLDATRKGIVLVVDKEQRIIGTVTDAVYLRPHGRYTLLDLGHSQLLADVAVIASWASVKSSMTAAWRRGVS